MVFGLRWLREPETGWEVHLLVQLILSAVLDSGVSRVGNAEGSSLDISAHDMNLPNTN